MRIIFIIFFPLAVWAQTPALDSLKPYSYHLFGLLSEKDSAVRVNTGTCFFIREGNRLFLVTAKHVLSGCSDKSLYSNLPKSMLLALSHENAMDLLSINIEPYRATTPCADPWMEPDLVVLPVSAESAKNVRSVEHLLWPPFKNVNRASIVGFPGIYNISEKGLKAVHPSVLDFQKDNFEFVRAMGDPIRKLEDTINYCIEVNIEGGSTLGGFSGSPFYVQDESTGKWRIAGILSGSRKPEKGKSPLYSVKIDYALTEIKRIMAN